MTPNVYSPYQIGVALNWWFCLSPEQKVEMHRKSSYNNSLHELNNNTIAIVDVHSKITHPVDIEIKGLPMNKDEMRMIWRRGLNTADPQRLSESAHKIAELLENSDYVSFAIIVK